MTRASPAETEHDLEYLDANESYCHTCNKRIPNAHVRFHGRAQPLDTAHPHTENTSQ